MLSGQFELLQTDIRNVISEELKRTWNKADMGAQYHPFSSKHIVIPSIMSNTATEGDLIY